MSASLVGSEMCIRDRDWPQQPKGRHWASGATVARRGLQHPCRWLGSLWPVSYTHLTLPTICSV
eukprot:11369525-Alexandrium_andersonii.AAC.1